MMAPDHSIGPYGLVTGPRSAFLPLVDHEAKFLEAQRRPLAKLFCPKEQVHLSPQGTHWPHA